MPFNSVVYSLILLLGALQGVVLVLAINRLSRANQSANRTLSLLIILISLALIARVFYEPVYYAQHPQWVVLADLILFLYGPLLYFYVNKLLFRKPIQRSALHCAPAVLHVALMLPFLVKDKVTFLASADAHATLFLLIEGVAILHIGLYSLASYRLVRERPRPGIGKVAAPPYPGYLNSVLFVIALCLLTWSVGFVVQLLKGPWVFNALFYNGVWITLSLVTYVLGYYAMNQPDVFKQLPVVEPKYQGATTTDVELQHIQESLERVMDQQKLYLKPDLTLVDLAISLTVQPHVLSRVINERMQRNFFDFVNDYRVNEFKLLVTLPNYQAFTLLAIAYDAGFNSKTTFNTAFKRVTGLTPSAYLKTQQKTPRK